MNKLKLVLWGFYLTTFAAIAQAAAQVPPPSQVPVATEPSTIDDVVKMFPLIVEAFKNGQYLLIGALVTLVLVFIFRQYLLPKLKIFTTNVLPLVSAVLGIIVGSSISVVGGASITEALLACLSGPLASTLWQAVAKYFMPDAPPSVNA